MVALSCTLPLPGAAKFIPSSMPIPGIRRTAIVMACFLVKGDDRGIRPFLAALAEGTEMCK
ncbi:hypothetical protein ASPWEDRAFT_562448 [Aspergillus wentii DTO 134E9]|uniref:Uncharacterized protein n=1 Tax=Aspergillus wentii DTO 134E9 TaxID=1073089 RepID=A0A1L9RGS9_ASPWE|nr:uncharacterized protein ASPWEDRAFT_562448 [Aspergillus wentii DTO 134E9]OJJ34149.1 hypothetical protein ASPWEDRAFT_562448 [Aspergillus wentii DTO 134E9]